MNSKSPPLILAFLGLQLVGRMPSHFLDDFKLEEKKFKNQ